MNGTGKGICKRGNAGRNALLACAILFGCHLSSRAQLQLPLSGSALIAVKTAAAAGDPAAQDTLAGESVRHGNFLDAELWYRRAAEQGYVHAQGKLGEMLLAHAGLGAGVKTQTAEAIGLEAIKWLKLAANGSNTLAQAELAGVYFNGQFVKADLLEAYKWGDIAAHAPLSIAGSEAGRSVRDAASRKMSFDQIVTARQRVATYYSHVPFTHEPPDPAWVADIKLTGVSGPPDARLAIINNQTFGTGDTSTLKLGGTTVQVHCLEVRDKSVLLRIAGLHRPRLLMMEADK